MNRLQLNWRICENLEQTVRRYCSNCGRIVPFEDTLRRRHNANGKNIHRYAIYKCVNNHTWNQKLEAYKAGERESVILEEKDSPYASAHSLSLSELKQANIGMVEIRLDAVEGVSRLDKMLSERIEDVSRSQIAKWIAEGTVLIDGAPASPNARIRTGQIVSWHVPCRIRSEAQQSGSSIQPKG
ncbi:S4 domain-containing protein [Paenibacillus sp. MBLB4367]|uniref:S4 domain-containing protein n=1 Tax=Paenibacillus sp. MBLB4367 TaxID=3384767 RepID=UPI0039080DC9